MLEFALAKELVIVNSIFGKNDEHLITYKSGGHATQIDYCLIRKVDRSSCLDCKVVLGTEMRTQHRLLVLVFRMRRKIAEKKIKVKKRSCGVDLKGIWSQPCQTRSRRRAIQVYQTVQIKCGRPWWKPFERCQRRH